MTASFYTDHTSRPCANGRDYASNSRRYHGLFGASNRVPLGRRERLVSRCGWKVTGAVTITIVDRVGRGTDYDLSPKAFRLLAGKHWKKVGRVTVRAREVGR